jgi:hypothetical protein
MKTIAKPELDQSLADELEPEYRFDYRQARPNRFAGKVDKSQVVVMLDADIAEVFTTPESVNTFLRALIKTMPQRKPTRRPPAGSARRPTVR